MSEQQRTTLKKVTMKGSEVSVDYELVETVGEVTAEATFSKKSYLQPHPDFKKAMQGFAELLAEACLLIPIGVKLPQGWKQTFLEGVTVTGITITRGETIGLVITGNVIDPRTNVGQLQLLSPLLREDEWMVAVYDELMALESEAYEYIFRKKSLYSQSTLDFAEEVAVAEGEPLAIEQKK